jgi:hypothetical protein
MPAPIVKNRIPPVFLFQERSRRNIFVVLSRYFASNLSVPDGNRDRHKAGWAGNNSP